MAKEMSFENQVRAMDKGGIMMLARLSGMKSPSTEEVIKWAVENEDSDEYGSGILAVVNRKGMLSKQSKDAILKKGIEKKNQPSKKKDDIGPDHGLEVPGDTPVKSDEEEIPESAGGEPMAKNDKRKEMVKTLLDWTDEGKIFG